jgi:SRSO17 transposase
MTDAQAVRCRKRLERFLVDLLEPVGRSERRHWGEVYVRCLLLDGERKSIEPLATRLPEGNVQAMQQFIGQSPWEWNGIWERLGKRMSAELEPDPAWVVDDTGFPKQGTHSVAVARQYSGTLGKTGNCQIAVSVHHVGEQGNMPLGWRLYLPESWANDAQRRSEAGIPEEIVFRKKWELALEIIDQIREWGLPDRVVLGDAGYGDSTEFREELERRELKYAVGVLPQVGVWPKPPKIIPLKTTGKGRPPTASRYGDQRPTTAQEAAVKAKGWRTIRWREGTKAGWNRASGRLGYSHPIVIRTVDRLARKYGYWWSGRLLRNRRPSTAFATFPLITHCDASYDSSNAAGRLNRIITNSKKNSAWITTKAATGKAGIIT